MHKAGYTFDELWIIAAYVLWVLAMSIGWGLVAIVPGRRGLAARLLRTRTLPQPAPDMALETR